MKITKIFFSYWFWPILLTLSFFSAVVFDFYPLSSLEYDVYDILSRIRKRESPKAVVVVAIDDESVRNIGSWPWPRDYVADMVRQISDYGANTFGICLLYPTLELNSGLQEIRNVRKAISEQKQPGEKRTLRNFDRLLEDSENRLDHDGQLIAAVKSARNAVLPLLFDMDHPESNHEPGLSGWLRMNSVVLQDKREDLELPPMGSSAFAGLQNDKNMIAGRVSRPFSELSRKSGALGHMNLTVDRDGVIRKIPLVIDYQGRKFLSLALQVARKYMGIPLTEVKSYSNGLRLEHIRIPTDSHYRMLIDYCGKDTSIRKFSFSDVREGKIPAEMFRDVIVLLGITAEEIVPRYETSVHSGISGVEIIAQAVENLVNRKHVSRPLWVPAVEFSALLYIGVFLLFVIPKVKPRVGALIMGIFLVNWIGAAGVLFVTNGIWLKTMTPILFAVIGFALVGRKKLADQRQDEKAELTKSLGLAQQSLGLLDTAFGTFLKCPVDKKSVKEALYNLGLDFERKRMFDRALGVYKHILKAGAFKDIGERIKRLKEIEKTIIMPGGSFKNQTSLLAKDDTIRPTLGRYEIIEELGKGAMGTVYLGRDPSINRDVAIKTLTYADVAKDELEEVKSRFFREAEAAGRLSHPNIVTIYDVGEDNGIAYMAMELLKGYDLTRHSGEINLLPVGRVLTVVLQVAQALDYAHNQGVVHRDIKPANIVLLNNDQVKVADFGIARVISSSKTETGTIFGTPNYMSPEQVAGKKVDGRSDLFSLGVVFYELLTGTKPFKGDNLTTLMFAIANSDYIPVKRVAPKTPPCCVKIVDKLLAKRFNRRFKSAAQAIEKIQMCQAMLK